MLVDETVYFVDLADVKSIVCSQLHRVKPEFRFVARRFDMDMRRFVAFIAKEMESVAADAEDSGNFANIPRSGGGANGERASRDGLATPAVLQLSAGGETMLVDAGLTFREIVMNDPLPKGTIQQAVFDFLHGRDDAAIFGAMAVNAYIDERRMTEHVDIVSTHGEEFAEELCEHLSKQFHIAVRVRVVRDGVGFRLYQLAKPQNRHLVGVRPVETLPPAERIDGILVVTPAEVIAGKVLSCVRRKGKPKSFTDRRDLAHMMLRFPELKAERGAVRQRLDANGADDETRAFWSELVAEEIRPEDEDDEFS
jgi:hypothetical protein